jgi:alkylation response protein AidB-like acyl-CoA dehydrogenase
MDFTLDAEQRALRDAARTLAERHRPDHGSPDSPVGPAPHDPDLWRALAEVGALGLPFSEEAGGFGASPVEASVVASELGRAGTTCAYADALVAGSLLASAGDAELLGAAAEGSAFVLPAVAEPGRAWSLTAFATNAVRSGDDWSLTGVKSPVLCGSSATHVVVAASVDDGVGVFLVERPEVGGDDVLTLDGTRARLLLAGEAAGAALDRAASLGIATLAGEAVGAMDSALSMTVDYLKGRKQFGVPLMTFQTLTQRAADMYTSVELARSAALFAAMALAEDPDDWATAARTKVVVGQAGRHVGQEAVQLHGGIGMTAEYAVGHRTTRLTAIEHSYGDTRWHLARLGAHVRDHEVVDVLG